MESKAKHTQGEWKVENGNIFCNGELIAMSATLLNRVDETRQEGESWLSMMNRTKPVRIECENEMDANAKLIAAAPILLDALLVMLDGSNAPEWKKDLAINAINKATQ